MSDRKDFYSGQLVKELDLDAAFTQLETGVARLAVDHGLAGIITGLAVEEEAVPSMSLNVDAGRAYDKIGRRVYLPTGDLVDMSIDEDGNSTTDDVVVGNERWLLLYARFARTASDPRGPDLANDIINFNLAESYELICVPGAQAAIGASVKPAVDDTDVLLCETLYVYGQTEIMTADLDFDRTDYMINSPSPGAGQLGIVNGDIFDALYAIIDAVNDIITGATTIDAGGVIFSSADPIWYDGQAAFTVPQPVDACLVNIVQDLASSGSGNMGTTRIGSYAITVGSVIIATGSLRSQLLALADAANHAIDAAAAWADGTTNPATDVETRINTHIIARLALTSAGDAGCKYIGMQTGLGNFGAKSSVYAWLAALANNTSATANGGYFISLYGTGLAGNWSSVTDVYGAFKRLTRTDAGTDGAAHIGTEAVGNLAGATVRAQLNELDTRSGGSFVPTAVVANTNPTITVAETTYRIDGVVGGDVTLSNPAAALGARPRVRLVLISGTGDVVNIKHSSTTVCHFTGNADTIGITNNPTWAEVQWDGSTYTTVGWGQQVVPDVY